MTTACTVVVGRIDEIAHACEARLLESTKRCVVLCVGVRDAGVRRLCHEHDVPHEPRDHFRSESYPGLVRIRQEEVDARNTFFDVHEASVVGVVRHEVGLDEAGGPIVDEDQVQIGGLAAHDRRQVARDHRVVALPFPPPELNVLALQPLV